MSLSILVLVIVSSNYFSLSGYRLFDFHCLKKLVFGFTDFFLFLFFLFFYFVTLFVNYFRCYYL